MNPAQAVGALIRRRNATEGFGGFEECMEKALGTAFRPGRSPLNVTPRLFGNGSRVKDIMGIR
ncbi:MAG: hypothetical protein JRJ54_11090 [Deltaproteobacteria bacterium]|nr:hypothetical protein [Deltaproteobacteria bacterium]